MVTRATKPQQPLQELGAGAGAGYTWTYRFNEDAFLPKLRGYQGVRTYREMRDNSAIIGGILLAMDMMLRGVDWRIEAADETAEAEEAKEFMESVIDDMEHSFGEFMSDALSMLTFGYSAHEMVFKRRVGPTETNPTRYSKFTDGKIGIRRLPTRAQWTIERFDIDENGDVIGIEQQLPNLIHDPADPRWNTRSPSGSRPQCAERRPDRAVNPAQRLSGLLLRLAPGGDRGHRHRARDERPAGRTHPVGVPGQQRYRRAEGLQEHDGDDPAGREVQRSGLRHVALRSAAE